MKYLVKFSPEITIKSRPVRSRFVRQLQNNLQRLLAKLHADIKVQARWDYLEIDNHLPGETLQRQVETVLETTPGVGSFSRVYSFPLDDMEQMLQHSLEVYGSRLRGKSFAVRCKRAGRHPFTSVEVERVIGGGINRLAGTRGVDLDKPDITVKLEIRDQELFVVDSKTAGLGGFPMGSQDAVLSLISGGFDSAVSSYMSMRRGLKTHFCFFNLGGRDHEIAVKEVALYLWMKYGASHGVKFVTVPFEGVVAEILSRVDNSQMGVVLKRMMLRAASRVAQDMELQALVTGESVAQVSSQTLANLAVIDKVTDLLVLRPLVMSEKQDIVDTARRIGTEEFSAAIPEYCGVISIKPTTRARMHRIEREESRFDFTVLDAAVAGRETFAIDRLALDQPDSNSASAQALPLVPVPEPGAVIIDIRHPDEAEENPLTLEGNEVRAIPFYKLNSVFTSPAVDPDGRYLLYCGKGIMSKLHGAYLLDQGFSHVGVYLPD